MKRLLFTLTAALVVCDHTLAGAQAVPDLSRFDDETRQSIELACIVQKSDGPAAYGLCLDKQIRALRGSPGIPSLSGFDDTTRQLIELVCITQKGDGPVAYGRCLDDQISAVRGSPGIPSLSGLDNPTRQSIELACITQKGDGPVAYGTCVRAQLRSIGIQPDDATPVQSPRPKRVNRNTGSSLSPQATPREHPGPREYSIPRHHTSAPSYWEDPGFWALITVGFVYLTPILWVLVSSRSHGGAKLGWLLVVLFFSWLGLAVFLIVTQATRDRPIT